MVIGVLLLGLSVVIGLVATTETRKSDGTPRTKLFILFAFFFASSLASGIGLVLGRRWGWWTATGSLIVTATFYFAISFMLDDNAASRIIAGVLLVPVGLLLLPSVRRGFARVERAAAGCRAPREPGDIRRGI
jgi:hypothetical protein